MEVVRLTRQDILTFSFPYKLWIVVQLDSCPFLRWNSDGTVLALDVAGLQSYLNSSYSIFNIKNCSSFLQHLDEFQFKRLNIAPEVEEDTLIQFVHKNFQRHRLDLVENIRRQSTRSQEHEIAYYDNFNGNIMYKPLELGAIRTLSPQVYSKRITENISNAKHMEGDLCFKFHGYISKIQASRLLFQAIISFQKETYNLQEKVKICEEEATQKNLLRAESAENDMEVINLPSDLYENPYESVSKFDRSQFGGYYGNCSKEQIMHLFGDHIEIKEYGSKKVNNITDDPNAIGENGFSNNESDQSFAQSFSQISFDYQVTTPQNYTAQHDGINLSNMSSLEPIFQSGADKPDNQSYVEEGAVGITETYNYTFQSSINTNTNVSSNAIEQYENTNYLEVINNANTEVADPPYTQQTEVLFSNFFDEYKASLNLLNENL